jgi:hypothetical protein
MKTEIKGNENYVATIVAIKNIIDLENCDNIKGTTIFGNHVIISNTVKIGDIGIFFPIECKIADCFLKANNLYQRPELNVDPTAKGFFAHQGRVRCVKLRGFPSEGFWIPINTLSKVKEFNITDYPREGISFDYIEDIKICEKYFVPRKQVHNGPRNEKKNKKARFSKIIETQFRFHIQVSQFYKNLDKIKEDSLIHISYKIHGCSGISAYILCKRKLPLFQKVLKKLGAWIKEEVYDYIWASRKVIKNEYLCKNTGGFYNEDIWKIANEELFPFLTPGISLYYEICGYLPSGKMIQKNFDYGCNPGEHKIYIYRITYTNICGNVFEMSAKQVQLWCKKNGLNAVPELYYGKAKDLIEGTYTEPFQDVFFKTLIAKYNNKDCYLCKNVVPEEGAVIRIEDTLDIESYKVKSSRFYERETKLLDAGEEDIEEAQSQESVV